MLQTVQLRPHCVHRLDRKNQRCVRTAVASPDTPSTSGRTLEYAPTRAPKGPGFLAPDEAGVDPWVRPPPVTITPPSVRDTGTLRPAAEWFPAWMKYRRREENYVFWQDKLQRCSLDVPDAEKRWTVFSSIWYLWMELKYFGTPPALRYIFYLIWRSLMLKLYEAHKTLVLWQAKVDAGLASKATNGSITTFSRAMTLRRLHWRNSVLAELLYLLNVGKTGRVHMLPPVRQPLQRPTLFFLF